MRFHKILLFIIFLSSSLTTTGLFGQIDDLDLVPVDAGEKLKPELRVVTGISIPLGKFAKLDSLSGVSAHGNAKNGFFIDLIGAQRIRRAPLWAAQLNIGYMQHNINDQLIRDSFNVSSFTSRPWSSYHIMPGIEFQGGTKVKFAFGINAGALIYSGWNSERGDYNLDDKIPNYQVRNWAFKHRVALGIKANFRLAFKLKNPRWRIITEASFIHAQGSRLGTLATSVYELDNNNIPTENILTANTVNVLHKSSITTVNVGIGIQYILYRYLTEPDLSSPNSIDL